MGKGEGKNMERTDVQKGKAIKKEASLRWREADVERLRNEKETKKTGLKKAPEELFFNMATGNEREASPNGVQWTRQDFKRARGRSMP